jgi:hypothetical protein
LRRKLVTKYKGPDYISKGFDEMSKGLMGMFEEGEHPRAAVGSMGSYRGGEFVPKGGGSGGGAGAGGMPTNVPVPTPVYKWFTNPDEADQWGIAGSLPTMESLTPDEIEAFNNYHSNLYSTVNSHLRYGGTVPEHISDTIKVMDYALDRSVIPDNVVAWRAINSKNFYDNANRLQGKTFQDPAFLSTSLFAPHVEEMLGGRKGIIAQMRLPKGSRGLYVGAAGGATNQHELLLPRGNQYRVTNVDDNGRVKHIVLEPEL